MTLKELFEKEISNSFYFKYATGEKQIFFQDEEISKLMPVRRIVISSSRIELNFPNY